MQVVVKPGPLSGRTAAIVSKSDAHRILLCAALCAQPTRVELPSRSQDIDATLRCLPALGARVEEMQGAVVVSPAFFQSAEKIFDCAESGSTFRFCLPIAAALGGRASFTGRGRLPERPVGPLLSQLVEHGASVTAEKLPFSIQGPITPGIYRLPGNVSSQFVTGLLLALPLLAGESSIELTSPLESSGYVDLTIRTLTRFGIKIEPIARGYHIPGGQRYISPGTIRPEGDWSNAAFFLSAGALSGPVAMTDLTVPSLQCDSEILPLLERFGAHAKMSGEEIVIRREAIRPCRIDVSMYPDLFPILAVVAAGGEGDTLLSGAARLRLKESDRIRATAQLLTALGGRVTEGEDFLVIHGTARLHGGMVDSFADHRIAMAAAVASALCRDPVVIEHAEAVEKSYPMFYEDMRKLGGKIDVL